MIRPAHLMVASLLPLLVAACAGTPTEPRPGPDAPLADPAGPAQPTAEGGVPQGIPMRTRLPNGLSVLLYPAEIGRGHAEIVLGYLAGTDAGKQGTADLAAETLLEQGDSTAGRVPLRQRIVSFGGGSRVDLGPGSTWITLRVPDDRVTDTVQALHDSLTAPAQPRAHLERIRDQLVQRRAAALQNDPVFGSIERMLLGDLDAHDHLAALAERDPTDVVLFLGGFCRPDRSVLAIRTGTEWVGLAQLLARTFGTWRSNGTASALATASRPSLRGGIHWAPSDGDVCRVALVLPLPQPWSEHATERDVLLNCLTLDGVGGRLEQMLADTGTGRLALRARHATQVEKSALVLEMEGSPDQAVLLWQAAQRALSSLVDIPATASELALATERTRLTAYREDAGDRGGLRARVIRALRNETDEWRFRQLATAPDAGSQTLRAAAASLIAAPMALVVSGGQPPASVAAVVRRLDLPPAAGGGNPALGDDAPGTAAGNAELSAAVQAAGGDLRLRRLDGYRGSSLTRGMGAVPVKEHLGWHRSGRLDRDLEVLDSVVQTRIEPGNWSEQVGDQRRTLEPREVELRTREAARHPLMLLAAWTRGDLRFRLVAIRPSQDREVAVFEAETDRFERLRLHIDRESHLVRTVETWETLPDGTPRYLQETWSDFRTVSGLRSPHRRDTDVDDGRQQTETVWSTFAAVFGS